MNRNGPSLIKHLSRAHLASDLGVELPLFLEDLLILSVQFVSDVSYFNWVVLLICLLGIDPNELSIINWYTVFKPLNPDPAVITHPNTSAVRHALTR